MDNKRIGLVIRTLRNKAGLTQQQLAEKLKVTDKAVSKWERGLGIPDISIINRLADILNIDSDNLLAGNIAYLENEWIGELRLDKFKSKISITTEVYGKPSVYLYFCYFALAGIKEIHIVGSEEEQTIIEKLLGNGEKFGFKLFYNENSIHERVMVIDGPVFLYGANLTKHFQRAMCFPNFETRLAMPCSGENSFLLNGKDQVSDISSSCQGYKPLPIYFINNRSDNKNCETLPKGIICIEMNCMNDVMAAGNLLQIISKYSGEQVYCLEEIVYRRGLIDKEKLKEIAGNSDYLYKLAYQR